MKKLAIVLMVVGASQVAPFAMGAQRAPSHLSAGSITLYDGYHESPVLALARMLGAGEAYDLAKRTSGRLSWLRFGAAWDTVTYWPARQTIVVVDTAGRELEAVQVMAVTPLEARPAGAPVFLGLEGRWVNPDDIEQGRHGRGVLILAGFADPTLGLGDVAEVRVRQKRSIAAAAPAASGGH